MKVNLGKPEEAGPAKPPAASGTGSVILTKSPKDKSPKWGTEKGLKPKFQTIIRK